MMKKILLILFLGIFLFSFVSACDSNPAICGNGEKEFGEECDDGNLNSGDGCSYLCRFEKPIIVPTIDPTSPDCSDDLIFCADVTSLTPLLLVKMSCRSGYTQINKTMVLTSGNTYCSGVSALTIGAFDGRVVECSVIASNAKGSTTKTLSTEYECPVCGNGVVEKSEECDNSSMNGILCSAGYDEFCSYCSDTCEVEEIQGGFCGDSVCESEFEDWMNCSNDCVKLPSCGDGFLDVLETCDYGGNNSLTCDALYGENCSFCHADSCQLKTISGGFCGDGDIQEDEECDNGNLIDDDSCSSLCKINEKEGDEKKTSGYSSLAQFESYCTPDWECSQFSECVDGMMYRDCVDTNRCEYSYNKPLTSTECGLPKVYLEEESSDFLIWGIALAAVLFLVLLSISIRK